MWAHAAPHDCAMQCLVDNYSAHRCGSTRSACPFAMPAHGYNHRRCRPCVRWVNPTRTKRKLLLSKGTETSKRNKGNDYARIPNVLLHVARRAEWHTSYYLILEATQQPTLHGVCCTLHNVCCTLHGVRCTLHGVCCTLHGVSCMLHAGHAYASGQHAPRLPCRSRAGPQPPHAP